VADHPEGAGEGEAGGAERRKAYLGYVAHEVRNPLSTALWSAELLVRIPAEERGGARGEKLSAMCLRSIARVRQLVEDHFLCERLDAGGIPVAGEPVTARAAAEAVVARRAEDAGAIALDVAPGLVVDADRALLDRALDALVAAAGRDGADVRIAAEPAGEAIALVVSGRAPEAGALEDPVKGSPSDPTGRALALPLARRIAAALGGTLTAADGRYVLTLPRARPEPARPDPGAHP
jgi:K+-sensing histidine kinase KdpD